MTTLVRRLWLKIEYQWFATDDNKECAIILYVESSVMLITTFDMSQHHMMSWELTAPSDVITTPRDIITSHHHVTPAKCHMMSSQHQVTSLNHHVTSSRTHRVGWDSRVGNGRRCYSNSKAVSHCREFFCMSDGRENFLSALPFALKFRLGFHF